MCLKRKVEYIACGQHGVRRSKNGGKWWVKQNCNDFVDCVWELEGLLLIASHWGFQPEKAVARCEIYKGRQLLCREVQTWKRDAVRKPLRKRPQVRWWLCKWRAGTRGSQVGIRGYLTDKIRVRSKNRN